MFKKRNSKLLFSLLMLICLSIGFYSCEQNEALDIQEPEISKSLFKQHLEDNTQRFVAQDQGVGQYSVTGEQGTRINIDNALVNSAGERVRGNVEIVLIEIYSVTDMILNRKQTLANYDGELKMLESGGEVFVKVYQDGEELFVDGKGDMRILLPTENTGGARNDMELFYGEEVGDQVMWYPTGEAIKVVNSADREGDGTDYLVLIRSILGWVNVDIISGAGGEEIDCVEIAIDCEEVCAGMGILSTTVAMVVPNVTGAFELNFDPMTGTYKMCANDPNGVGSLPLGGLTVTFIVVIECEDGSIYVAIVSVTIDIDNPSTILNCENFTQMSKDELVDQLAQLL